MGEINAALKIQNGGFADGDQTVGRITEEMGFVSRQVQEISHSLTEPLGFTPERTFRFIPRVDDPHEAKQTSDSQLPAPPPPADTEDLYQRQRKLRNSAISCYLTLGRHCDCDLTLGRHCDCDLTLGRHGDCDLTLGRHCDCDLTLGRHCDCDLTLGRQCDCDLTLGRHCDCDLTLGRQCDCDLTQSLQFANRCRSPHLHFMCSQRRL
jgi:hypothetical protein